RSPHAALPRREGGSDRAERKWLRLRGAEAAPGRAHDTRHDHSVRRARHLARGAPCSRCGVLALAPVGSPDLSSSILVLQHIACEPPAAFEDELRSRGLDVTRVELDQGEPLPDWRDHPAIVVMGGPMGAYDEADHPWLVEEKRLLREAVEADTPVWGVCLGAQLLASALGARVYRGEQPEVGVLPVHLTSEAADDPVFAGAPDSFPTLQWHGDSFDL